MHVAEQQGLIAKMDRQREDSTLARAILDTLIETQALHRQDHKRIQCAERSPSVGTNLRDQRITVMVTLPTNELLNRADQAVSRSPQSGSGAKRASRPCPFPRKPGAHYADYDLGGKRSAAISNTGWRA